MSQRGDIVECLALVYSVRRYERTASFGSAETGRRKIAKKTKFTGRACAVNDDPFGVAA
jgi:hypothetical protein